MKRENLAAALRQNAGQLGYLFFSGPENMIPARVNGFPALWLSPLKLTASGGREECNDTYHVVMRLMMTCPADSGESLEEIWGILENDARSLLRSLDGVDFIHRIRNVRLTPEKSHLTKNAEYSLAAECDMDLFYFA